MAHDDPDADDGVRRWFYGGTAPDDEIPPPPGPRAATAREMSADEALARAWATATLHRLRARAAVARPS